MKKGIKILEETIGEGDEVVRQNYYRIELRCWLNQGESVKWKHAWGMVDRSEIHEDGALLITDVRINRDWLFNGLFYGMQGMKIGGIRKLKISPQLAYGEKGLPGIIPENAVLICEVKVLARRHAA